MGGCGRSVPFGITRSQTFTALPHSGCGGEQARTFDCLEFWGTDRVERLSCKLDKVKRHFGLGVFAMHVTPAGT